MNIYGETQDKEKMIPATIRRLVRGNPAIIYGNNDYIGSRFWIYAKNVADAVLTLVLNECIINCKVNIPGNTEFNNLEMAHKIADILNIPLKYELIEPTNVRPGYDRRYHITGKILKDWQPPFDFEDSLTKTVMFTKNNLVWIK
jgi:dTDP-glucose 4,6-dehydratase